MFIKICANTSLEDSLLAVEAGADALGFVFAPSKRQVTAAQVAEITPGLPTAIAKIGVFDSQDSEEIARIVETAGLTGVQLHGGLDLNLIHALRQQIGGKAMLIQTLHWQLEESNAAQKLQDDLLAVAEEGALIDAVLIDSRLASSASGGTGRSFDWHRAAQAISALSQADEITEISASGEMVEMKSPPRIHLPKIIVAGGLHPGNVSDAIAALRPWGVDVASGVEASPGKKDAEKLRAFISAARSAHVQ